MAFFLFHDKIPNGEFMEKIINKEVLATGVVIITMTNKDVNNNMTWSAVEDIANAIEISRNSGSNILRHTSDHTLFPIR